MEEILNSYLGVIITILAYIIWFVIVPILRIIGNLLKSLMKVIVKILDFVRRVIVVLIVFTGSVFGYLLLFDVNTAIKLVAPVEKLSRELMNINGIVMLIGLAILAFLIARYYLKTPLSSEEISLPIDMDFPSEREDS